MYNLLNIKEIAAKKNISVKKLVSIIEISEPGFYKSLDNNSMNIKTLAKIAKVLKVSISELINDTLDESQGEALNKIEVLEAPVAIYEPPTELAQCYKIMYEQQKEITELTAECERLKNAYAPVKDAQAG